MQRVINMKYFNKLYIRCKNLLAPLTMHTDIQSRLLNLVKNKIDSRDNIGHVLGDLLNISPDAVYRRNRNETPLTISEIEKICNHFHISFDSLMGKTENAVVFNYNPLHYYDFSLEGYLQGMLIPFRQLRKCTNPYLVLTSNNISIFQLLNFPRLSRFRLYFWAKTHLHLEEYKDKKYREERVTDSAFEMGAEILDAYVHTPTIECYDPEFLKGFIRQIQYYSDARLFEDPNHALVLIDEVRHMTDHIKEQINIGRKFKHRDNPENVGQKYDVYLNDTINADNSFYYSSEEIEGIYISHNLMNYLHTTDPSYVHETKSILDKQIANSSLISQVNEKQRNAFFYKLYKNIESTRNQILVDLES
jgi:hypothetical protein